MPVREGQRGLLDRETNSRVVFSLGWHNSRAGIASDSYLCPRLRWCFDKCPVADSKAASEQSGDSVPVALRQENSPSGWPGREKE